MLEPKPENVTIKEVGNEVKADTNIKTEREQRNEEMITELLSEAKNRMDLIEFTLRQANGKLDQKAFELLLIELRSDLHNMGDRAITDTGGPINL